MGCLFYFTASVILFSVSEMYILLYVASRTSLGLTILLCIFTGLAGGALVRREGLATISRIESEVSKGNLPADELIGGLLLIIVGVLLMVPGFITDTIGFLIVIPPVRSVVARAIREGIQRKMADGSIGINEVSGKGWGNIFKGKRETHRDFAGEDEYEFPSTRFDGFDVNSEDDIIDVEVEDENND